MARLSFGERARLALAKLVAAGSNLLVLDEPINHLDIPSREGFERGLAAFTGTVLVVAHGVLFMAAIWLWAENRRPRIKDNYMGRAHVTELRRTGAGRWRVERFNVSPEAALAGGLQGAGAAE